MSDHFHVCARGVLGLRTNAESFKWSWGTGPAVSREEYDGCAVRLSMHVGDVAVPDDAAATPAGKYHYFSGRPGDDSVYYERTLLGKRNLRLHLAGLLGAEPALSVNPDYLRYVTHRFMNLHSAGYVLTDVAGLSLLRHGFAPLHCSAFRSGEATVLVLAPPNTGKTLTTMMACLEHGAEFLAEDLAITDGKVVFSVPWTSTFRYYDRIDASRRSRLLNRLTAAVPPVELLGLGKTSGVDTLVQRDRLLNDAPVTHVVVLERGNETVATEGAEETYRKAVNLNRYEFNYVKAPALVASEFFNPAVDLDAAAAEERRILRAVVDNAAERLVVRTHDATRYTSLILDHLDRR